MTEEDPLTAVAEIKRSQSSLELLSNTAAWQNVIEKQQHSSGQRTTHSPSLARVSPAEQILKAHSFTGATSGEHGLSLEEGAAPYSPSLSSQPDPGLSLNYNSYMNGSHSSVSLISSSSSGNLQANLPDFGSSSWHRSLNPSITMHAAFTPPRSNLRAPRQHTAAAESTLAPTRSLPQQQQHDAHGAVQFAQSRPGSSDEGEWSWGASMDSVHSTEGPIKFTDELAALRAENEKLKTKLLEKDDVITNLTHEKEDLQTRVDELRQLPTGKISQIPIEDMMSLMRTYGSEISDTVMPPRKTKIQKASVIRQFRRWNPHFLDYFHYHQGKWVAKLGKEGELKRREDVRCQQRRVPGAALSPVTTKADQTAAV